MTDYQPLDLSALCNAGQEVLGRQAPAAVGPQHFHGLPFLIGGQGDRHFIALKGGDAPVTIPVGAQAYHVLFVQRLLESDADSGGQPGRLVAEYRVRYADGSEAVVPIRERFEVQAVPVPWGQVAYRAVPDQKNALMPRHEGRWDAMGRRQTEAAQGTARDYYVWAWPNPRPDTPIASVTVTACGPAFLIAAITLGQADEHPFARQGRRETRITLTDAADAAKRFDLDVEVDRGVTTYVHPLPQADADAFLRDPFKGWGQAQNEQSSPAYVEIAATPSATVTVKQGGETVGQVRWGDVETKGAVETPRLQVELLDRGKNWVHVTVVDDATGQPLPCRVHFRSPEGIPYQPHGNHNQVNSNLGSWHSDVGGDVRLGHITYAYIDGTCQGWLPRGQVMVDVARGFEYEPLRTTVAIQPGQRELTLRLKRWTDMNAQGWYSGDSHVHFLSANGSHTEALAEDLNVVNLLQSQWGSLFTNTEEYAGKPGVSQRGNSIVYCSQENRQHFLGHLTLWGLKEPVMPWCSDGPSEAEMGGTLDVTMSDWADRCRAQGGTVILPHMPAPNGEPAALIATGRVDAVEMIRHNAFAHHEYYLFLILWYGPLR